MSTEDIYNFSGLQVTAQLHTNCHVDFPLNQKTQKTKGQVYIIAAKQVCDELVKLNGLKLKGIFLFIEIAKVKPKITNPNKIYFTSPNRFESLRFVNNSLDLGNDIEHSEENDLGADFKRTVRNSQQNQNYISKQRPLVEVNAHPENQITFSKVPITPRDKSYSDTITKRTEQENILIFNDSIPSRIKMYNLNKALKNEYIYH